MFSLDSRKSILSWVHNYREPSEHGRLELIAATLPRLPLLAGRGSAIDRRLDGPSFSSCSFSSERRGSKATSKRKDVTWGIPLHTKIQLRPKPPPQPSNLQPVATVETVVLYFVGPISKNRDETIPLREPAEHPQIRRLELPHRRLLMANHPKVPNGRERSATNEFVEKQVQLLGGRQVRPHGRWLQFP